MKKKTRVKFKEKVTFYGKKKTAIVTARIDTGAKRCSIDRRLATKIGMGNIIKYKKVRSASGVSKRPLVKIKLKLKNRTFLTICSIADRSRLKYPALIGRTILRKGFMVEGK
jgi:hypothetical protein